MRVGSGSALLLLALSVSAPLEAAPSPQTDARLEHFERAIRPLLAERCYRCHNAVDRREAGLALDHAAGWRTGGRRGPAIVPGDAEASLLYRSVAHAPGLEGMPEDEPRLEPRELEAVRQWIDDGALDPRTEVPTAADLAAATAWEAIRDRRDGWWSFQPLDDPVVPATMEHDWPRDPLDHFVLERLAPGERPAPDRSRRDWLRRASDVLTGLPPSPEELDAFAAGTEESDFSAAIDRLLASPASSERLARHWMDLWRYAESHGSEGDPSIAHAWRYRDALVRAFDSNLPWDQLLMEHVAGDLGEPRLDPAGEVNDAAALTAQLRFPFYGYAPTDALAEQVRTVDNQIDVITKASMGLTVSCARCHDHKFDPISQADWTALYSTLLSARPGTVAVDAPARREQSVAALQALRPQLREALARDWTEPIAALAERLERGEVALPDPADAGPGAVLGLLVHAAEEPERTAALLAETRAQVAAGRERLARRRSESNGSAWHLGTDDAYAWYAEGTTLTPTPEPAGSFAVLPEGDAVLDALLPSGIYSHLLSDKHAAVLTSPWFTMEEGELWIRVMGGGGARTRYVPRAYPRAVGPIYKTHEANARTPEWRRWSMDFWAGDRAYLEIATARDLAVEVRGQERSRWGLSEVALVPRGAPAPRPELAECAGPLADEPGAPQDLEGLRAHYAATAMTCLEAWQAGTARDDQVRFLDGLLQAGLLPRTLDALPRTAPLALEWRTLEAEVPVPLRAPGVLPGERVDQALMHRGVPTDLRDPVAPRFLEVLDPTPFARTKDPRAALARALVAPSNPLTPRAAVNRLWAWVFGEGLVPTTENLGLLAPEPEHLKLLDHLASSFVASGWDTRALLRRLVLSRTFRQESAPRRRDAEALRDAMLQASGRLDPARLGPSDGEGSGRRSLYVSQRRGSPPAFLRAFGLPDAASTQGTRPETNVPAQALALLNGDLAREAARGLAARARREGAASDEAAVERMWGLALGRAPANDERAAALAFLADLTAVRDEAAGTHAAVLAEEAQAVAGAEELLASGRARVREARGEDATTASTLPAPIAAWEFEGDLDDAIGSLHGELIGAGRLEDGALVLEGGWVLTPPLPRDLGARTLEARVRLDGLDQRGSGLVTVQQLQGGVFDSIVFNERRPGEWLAGSDFFNRTDDLGGPPEREQDFVVLTLTYAEDGTITAYRNGAPYGAPIRKSELVTYEAGRSQFLLGGRHGSRTGMAGALRGALDHARVFDRALRPDEVAASAASDPNFVTRADALRALDPAERRRLEDLELQATEARARAEAVDALATSPPDQPWTELAAALFLLEEFRYLP